MLLMAIDPGPSESAYVLLNTATGRLMEWSKLPNAELMEALRADIADDLVIEMIASYGMPVGKDVFETCVWIGRFWQMWVAAQRPTPSRLTRIQVKSHVCHSARATDANVRQALIDRFGPGKDAAIGKKASPGPLYGLSGDGWAALAVAVTYADEHLEPLHD